MNEQNKPNSLDGLIEAATDSVRQQHEEAATLAAKRPPKPRGKQIFTLILLVAFAGAFSYQYPRFVEPYALPDPDNNPTVIEADLEVIGGLIETYRLSQGRYPDSLDKVRLPPSLAKAVAHTKLEYQLKEQSYVLNWALPHWHAALDAETGKVTVAPAKGTK